MDVASPFSKEEFDSIYHTFAPLSYGIAFRITQAEQLAEAILAAVFVDLCGQGKLKGVGVKEILAATFTSAHTVLSRLWPVSEVQQRIAAEQNRLLRNCRSRGPVGLATVLS